MGRKTNQKTEKTEQGEWRREGLFTGSGGGWEWGIDESSLRAKRLRDKGMTMSFYGYPSLAFASSFTADANAIIDGYSTYGGILGQRSPSVTVHSSHAR
jgi:hypothetical protein